MTDEAASPVEDDVCKWCNSYWDDHDHEHLACTCYPLRIDKLHADYQQHLAAAQRKLEGHEQNCLANHVDTSEAEVKIAAARAEAVADYEEAFGKQHGCSPQAMAGSAQRCQQELDSAKDELQQLRLDYLNLQTQYLEATTNRETTR